MAGKSSDGVNLRNLPRDKNRIAVQACQTFVTQDETGTPKTSPLNYSSSVITLAVPQRAVNFTIMPTTDLKISDDSTMTTYDFILAYSKEVKECAGMTSIYIVRSASDGIAYFTFGIV